MGSKALKEAKNLGLLKLRHTAIYSRARKIRATFSKYIPDVADEIRDYILASDPDLVHDRSGGGRNNSFFYLSTKLQLFVQVTDKAAGFAVVNPSNHAIQIEIYCDNDEIIRGIAKAVNDVYADEGGMLAHMEWNKIEKKFKVKADDCIATWNSLLS